MSLKRQAARSALWSGVQIAGNQATSFAVFLVLTHLLSPAEIGVAALAMSLVEVVAPLMRAGLPEALIQRADLREIDADTCFWSSLALSVVLAAAVAASAHVIGRAFGSMMLAPVVITLSPLLPLSALSATHEARIAREFGFKSLAIRTVLGNLVGGGVGLLLAWQGYGVWSLVGQRLVGNASGAVLIWSIYRWVPRFRFSMTTLRQLYGFGLPMTAVSFLNSINSRIFDFLVGFFIGPAGVGYVRVASRCMDMVTQFAVYPLTSVAFPTLSRLQQDPEAFGRALRRMVQVCALLTFPAYFGLAVVARDLVPLAFGRQWAISGALLSILCLSAVPITLQNLTWPALAATGRSDISALGSAIIVASAVIFTATGSYWGLYGIVIAHVARNYTTLPLSLSLLQRYTGVLARSLVSVVYRPAISALLMAGVVLLAAPLIATAPVPVRIGSSILIGVVSYGVFVCICARPLLRDVGLILRSPRRAAAT